MCLSRDHEGRSPLHLAIIKGRVEMTDHCENVLHLCVKHNNQLEALNLLMDMISDDKLKRDAIMVVALLIVTMANQGGMNPPGGDFPGNKEADFIRTSSHISYDTGKANNIVANRWIAFKEKEFHVGFDDYHVVDNYIVSNHLWHIHLHHHTRE
ncbi:hypothetical protein H5410_042471 [Solanum commersonii]|uniref:PGG domain-containing protein n=1 Tax=Solanum commersonii TaxID=4109 RepID=A0A9J5XVS7_SOLCO|nr:hypothetical protein H5410_042471 [Solanum commersonii]